MVTPMVTVGDSRQRERQRKRRASAVNEILVFMTSS
jgi:hypothetical protein